MLDSSSSSPENSFLPALLRLYGHLSKRRRFQLGLVFALMVAGAIADLATIAAVIPFIGLLSAPDQLASIPLLTELFSLFGWTNSDDKTVPLTILFINIVLIAGFIRILLAWVSQKYVLRVGHDLSVSVYRSALFKPFIYHTSHNSSDIIAGIAKSQIATSTTLVPLLNAATGAVLSITMLSALLAIDAGIALGAIVAFATTYIGISIFGKTSLQSNSKVIADSQTRRVRAVQEGIGGIRDVVIDHVQDVYLKRFAVADLAVRDAQTRNGLIGIVPRYVIETFSIIVVAIYVLILSGNEGGLAGALPLLGAFALAGQRILPAMHNIFQSWTQIKGNQHQLVDVLNLIEITAESRLRLLSNAPPLHFVREISLSNVSFKYGLGDKLVFDEVSLTIQKGSRVGFLGKTGSGKSTIVDLIMGLLEPVLGQIRVDDILLTQNNITRWQSNIAHVAQDVYLADTSIAENIAFGVPREEIDFGRVEKAARQAAISNFIEGLSDGYNTVVGERGARLSGGQKQRIGIARAIYKQATIFVFDEATSALDNETEVEVMEAIQSLGSDITILIIAHRPSTVAGCDQIYHVENGKVSTFEGDSISVDDNLR